MDRFNHFLEPNLPVKFDESHIFLYIDIDECEQPKDHGCFGECLAIRMGHSTVGAREDSKEMPANLMDATSPHRIEVANFS